VFVKMGISRSASCFTHESEARPSPNPSLLTPPGDAARVCQDAAALLACRGLQASGGFLPPPLSLSLSRSLSLSLALSRSLSLSLAHSLSLRGLRVEGQGQTPKVIG